jgi:hypothetical protein
MDSIDLFRSQEASLPRKRGERESDFCAYLANLFHGYINLAEAIDANDATSIGIRGSVGHMNDFSKHILNAVSEYLKGFPHHAYEIIVNLLELHGSIFERLIVPAGMGTRHGLDQLYRVRVEKTPGEGASFDKSGMFHIPFEKRHIVARQRYSLPGIPCLYLGGSLLVCWDELNRPNFDSIYLARFNPTDVDSLRMIDFQLTPIMIANFLSDQTSNVHDYLKSPDVVHYVSAKATCWPLLAACSLQRIHKDDPFIHEYIVPQLLLQWIVDKRKVDGIRYFSVKGSKFAGFPQLMANYVFPPKSVHSSGHCPELRSMFALTEPMSWTLVESCGLPARMTVGSPVCGPSQVELISGSPIQYYLTPFCRVESKALAYPCSPF